MDGLSIVMFDNAREMGIECGSLGAGMAEEILQTTQPHATFNQMGSKAVSKCVYGDFFLMPHCKTIFLKACCTVPWLMGFCAD